MQDLWPTILEPTEMTAPPIVILRQQASMLGKKTNNIIIADVKSDDFKSGCFLYNFNIICPALNNYHYKLFTIDYDINLYPANITTDVISENKSNLFIANNEEELLKFLETIFKSPKTIQVIQALLAQVKS